MECCAFLVSFPSRSDLRALQSVLLNPPVLFALLASPRPTLLLAKALVAKTTTEG